MDEEKTVNELLGITDEEYGKDRDFGVQLAMKLVIQPKYNVSDAVKEIAALDISQERKIFMTMGIGKCYEAAGQLLKRASKLMGER